MTGRGPWCAPHCLLTRSSSLALARPPLHSTAVSDGRSRAGPPQPPAGRVHQPQTGPERPSPLTRRLLPTSNQYKTSTGSYRSCATLLDISNPLKYFLELSFVCLVSVWFGLIWLVWVGLFWLSLVWAISIDWFG